MVILYPNLDAILADGVLAAIKTSLSLIGLWLDTDCTNVVLLWVRALTMLLNVGLDSSPLTSKLLAL